VPVRVVSLAPFAYLPSWGFVRRLVAFRQQWPELEERLAAAVNLPRRTIRLRPCQVAAVFGAGTKPAPRDTWRDKTAEQILDDLNALAQRVRSDLSIEPAE